MRTPVGGHRAQPHDAQYHYTSRLAADPRFEAVWDSRRPLTAVQIGLVDGTVLAEAIADYEQLTGVLVVAPPPPTAEPELADPATPAPTELVVGSRQVNAPPVPVTCNAGFGVEPPPNELHPAEETFVAPTPAGALAAFLEQAENVPPWPTGWVELVDPDGTISLGYESEPGFILGVVRVAPSGDGYAVSEWEITGC